MKYLNNMDGVTCFEYDQRDNMETDFKPLQLSLTGKCVSLLRTVLIVLCN